ncbi:lysine exporter LysO family protein [Stenoxybacter acetivorans]|uniref:lysine exporter LysO family protein n=1 Tax=Stenoxybacter acetivorans TaxID=422441 RepID=UPI00055B3349|nr:lysine exporter LysO family protein [Stenoxybacter acetivorans]
MHSLITLVSILLPLFAGFFVRLPPLLLRRVNQALNILVYVILALIGLSLARVDNLGQQIGFVALAAGVLFVCVVGFNILALIWFGAKFPWRHSIHGSNIRQNVSLSGSLKQIGCVLLGFVFGLLLPAYWLPPESLSNYALMLLVFFVGMQLRGSGITLRQVLLNKYGVQISAVFMVSCLVAGVLFALIMPDVSVSKGLALSSGYGWYSLSGIVMTEAYGPVWGSVALVNDLAREFFALAFIPVLMRRWVGAAVGVGGATSLDFTLPVIQSSGGVEVVPLAISFGFVVNVASPILMVVFSTL